jgi:hypothetical protein
VWLGVYLLYRPGQKDRMARVNPSFGRRPGRLGLALAVLDIWRRIPPAHRRRLIAQARQHGPRLAKQYAARRRRPRAR